MLGLFVTLGIAILTLLVILLWFVPHLLQQQAQQTAREAAHLHAMLVDMVSEHEGVAQRQGQLGTNLSALQNQLVQLERDTTTTLQSRPFAGKAELHELEQRVLLLQRQIESHIHLSRAQVEQNNESWASLLGLLAAIQERIHELSHHHNNPSSCHSSWRKTQNL